MAEYTARMWAGVAVPAWAARPVAIAAAHAFVPSAVKPTVVAPATYALSAAPPG
jgi:hypothetical protein